MKNKYTRENEEFIVPDFIKIIGSEALLSYFQNEARWK